MQNMVMKPLMTIQYAAALLAAFCLVPALAVAQPAPTGAPATPAAAAGMPFTAIADKPAVLYDGPSVRANKLFVLSRNHPLELLVRLDKWAKVRDSEGTIGWVENASLGDKKYVQVVAAVAEVRASAAAGAAVIFEAQRGVVLEILVPAANGWLQVRHRDGQDGFVRSAQVWGG